MTPDGALHRIAEAVADGTPVDWESTTGAGPDEAREKIVQLRTLALIRRTHEELRHAAEGDARPGVSDETARIDDAGSTESWGPLRLEGLVGSGGHADVVRAFDPALRKHVALKLRPAGAIRDDEGFLEEARRLARVRHPNVVVVHGAARHDGRAGLWMDLIEGESLEQRLRAQGPCGAEEAAVIGLDVLRALAAVHAAGLVHRDVKTSNVMRERGGRIVLMDFSVAIGRPEAERLEGRNSLAGTWHFMAPELFAGRAPSVASDVYGAGVLLYRLVTGSFPVQGANPQDLAARHARGERIPLRDARPDLPAAFLQVVERACHPDPAARYASAGLMEAALAETVGGGNGGGPREPRGGGAHGRRRGVLVAAAIAAAAAVTAVALVVFRPVPLDVEASLYRRRPPAEERLAAGARVGPGDKLFLEVRGSRAMYLYVFNEDDRGNAYLLFPLSTFALRNPLPTGTVHRLPGARSDGTRMTWDVSSVGGRERIYAIASPRRLDELEREIATLPEAGAAPAVAIPRESVARLRRGIGAVAEEEPAPGTPAAGLARTFERARAGAERAGDLWVWSIELDNPGSAP